jgi:hypothetical protein
VFVPPECTAEAQDSYLAAWVVPLTDRSGRGLIVKETAAGTVIPGLLPEVRLPVSAHRLSIT